MDKIDFNLGDIAINNIQLQILKARKELYKKIEAYLQERLAAGEFTKETLARDYVLIEWEDWEGLKLSFHAEIVKRTDTGSILIHGRPIEIQQVLNGSDV